MVEKYAPVDSASRLKSCRWFELAQHFDSIDDIQRSLKYYNGAIDLSPNDPELYFHRGLFKLVKMDLNDDVAWSAIKDFDRAIRLNSGYAAAYFERGVALSYVVVKDRACEDMKAAVALDSSFLPPAQVYFQKCCYSRSPLPK